MAGEELRPGENEHTVSVAFAYVLAIAVLLAALAFFLGAHVHRWGAEGVEFAWLHAAALLPLTVAHEGLHGLGFLLAGAPRSEIRFGFALRRLTPYAHCGAPMRARGYRLSVLLPGIGLGVIPAVLGLALGLGWMTVLGAVMIGAAGGDFAVMWAIRAVPAAARVRNHSSQPGCVVLADEVTEAG